jgi:IMP dehydrogenase
MHIKETVTFDDVLLVPQYSEVISRKSIDIGSALSNDVRLTLPLISAPMDTVTDNVVSTILASNGAFGIIHRYNTIEEQVAEVSLVVGRGYKTGAAIGITGDYIERAMALAKAGCSVLCIDVAHGHHVLTRHALKTLRNSVGYDIHIMAGNVATLQAFNDLSDWGADSIRVGIGGGSICSTRIQTGHGVPTLQSVMDCSRSDRDACLIADGGIKTSGDMVKALAAGADFVMVGSLLAGCSESPGKITYKNGVAYKSYRGMASVEAQIDWRGHTASVEGVSHLLMPKGNIKDILSDLSRGIKSGFSYSGCINLNDLHSKSQFIKQTSAGQVESTTHIKLR